MIILVLVQFAIDWGMAALRAVREPRATKIAVNLALMRSFHTWPAPFDYITKKISRAANFVAIVLVGLATVAATAGQTRNALWPVVNACVVNHELTGEAFPCLSVHIDEGQSRGFVVLRPPIGRPDTILAPTRRSIGIEDPWLQDPNAPNYLAEAWRARSLSAEAGPISDDRLALAVNSRWARSQDQFHVHIGCLKPQLRPWLREQAARLAPDIWSQLPAKYGFSNLWGRLILSADLTGVNIFRLIAAGLPDEGSSDALALTTFAVARTPLANGDPGFLVVAWRHKLGESNSDMTAEDLLEIRCFPDTR